MKPRPPATRQPADRQPLQRGTLLACLVAASAISVASAADAQQVELRKTGEICNEATSDFPALLDQLEAAGWTRIAPADLTEDDLTLFTFAGMPNRIGPEEPDPGAWAQAWKMGRGGADGLRRLAPSEGPAFHRAFLRAENAVMRADLTSPEGAQVYGLGCIVTVAGEGADALAHDGQPPVELAHYTNAPNGLGAAFVFTFRPSAIAERAGEETLAIDPDLVTTLNLFKDIPAQQVPQ
ncbi:hypothetical protein JJJ17_02830 [Paracoccus caeni]|uniref:Uncharacterized protein n=1 Tax=Paracoccus caeni TaxID=657651 RepID=A0A934SCM2_9RHOB|nr:hypothetical protein [Paracoccus caeni]MBK4214854.1 hypothetical protein [Paracoccus caeni]